MEDILFFDIETVSSAEFKDELSEEMQSLWSTKFASLRKAGVFGSDLEDITEEEGYAAKAAIYAEFAKVVCISIGFIHNKDGKRGLRIKSIFGDDERKVLQEFAGLLEKHFSRYRLCGHNIKEFDIPFLSRRMIINGLNIPYTMNVMGKKPWEVNFIDTMEMWKFGDFKSFTSLKTLTAVFGIPSPKDDIDGSQVSMVYYRENDLDRISRYCQKDVLATAQVYLRMVNAPLIEASNVEFV